MAVANPIARYLFTEGAGTTIADSVGSNSLALNFNSQGSWLTGTGRGGVSSTQTMGAGGAVSSMTANLIDIATNGDIGSSFANATGMSVVMVVDLPTLGTAKGENLFRLGVDGPAWGDVEFVHGAGLTLQWGKAGDSGAGSISFQNYTLAGGQENVPFVMSVVIDTTQALVADRARMWINSIEIPQAISQPSPIAQNTSLGLVNATDRNMCFFNTNNTTNPTWYKNIEGNLYYAEVFTGQLTPVQVGVYATNLLLDADTNGSITPADNTAPVLTTPTKSALAGTSVNGVVTTDEANGTIYSYIAAAATANIATIKTGVSQAVSSAGVQTIPHTGLTQSTDYFISYVHTDAAGNDSNVVSTTQMTTSAAPADVTPPVLSSFVQGAITTSTANATVATDEVGALAGTIYYVVTENSTENAATIKAGSSVSANGTSPFAINITGLAGSTAYYYHIIQVDTAGNDSNIINSPTFSTDSGPVEITDVTEGLLREGDLIRLSLTNASASGKTITIPAGSLTVAEQTTTYIDFIIPAIKTFGTKVTPYNIAVPVTIADGGDEDTFNIVISPAIGYYDAEIATVGGIYLDDVTVEINSEGYGHFLQGSGTVDLASGNIAPSTVAQFEYWVRDINDGVWSTSAIETFEDPTRNSVTVANPSAGDGSVLKGATGSDVINGDVIYYDPVTTPSSIGVTVAPTGIWSLASMPGSSQTFTAYVVKADGSVGTVATYTFQITSDVIAPILTLPTGTATGPTTGSGTVTTDEGNGTLFYQVTPASTSNVSTVKAGSSQSVTATGLQTIAVTGLTTGTAYYLHYVHTDEAGNDSGLVTIAAAFTPVGSDTTAPLLTLPSGTPTSTTALQVSVTTDEGNGTIYIRGSLTSAPLSAAVLKGSSWFKTVTGIGVQTLSLTALAPSTPYYINYLHVDAEGNESDVLISSPVSTLGGAPSFVATPSVIDESSTSAEISFDVTASGFYRLVVVANESTAPSTAQILNGQDSTGAEAIYASDYEAVGVENSTAEVITGLTSGTSYDVYFVLTNGGGHNRAPVKVDINTTAIGNEPPTINSTAITTATATILYTYNVASSDPEGDPKTLTATVKPAWLTLSGSTLSGTPTSDNVGNHNVTLRVADSKGSTTQSFVINVLVPPSQSPYNNGEISTVNGVSSVAANTPLVIKSLNGTVVKGVVVADFEEDSIPITYPSTEAPRYQHAWNSYTDKGTVMGEETYAFVEDDDAIYGDKVFRVITHEERPYPQINTNVSSTASVFIREAIKSGTWEFNTYNRLRLWVKFPKSFAGSTSGDTNLHFGTYVRGIDGDKSSSESGGGGHYYHYLHVEPTNQWHQVIIDWHPQHQRQNDPNYEWSDRQYPVKDDDNALYNYFDLMTRFYFEFKPIGYDFGTYPIQVDIAGVEVYEEQRPESVLHIASLNGVYDDSEGNNMLHIGWSRIKADDSTQFEVRYAFSDIWLSGWDAATVAPSGTVSPTGPGTYARCAYDNGTINMGSNTKVYVAIKRVGDDESLKRQIIIPLTKAGYPPLGGNQ